MDSKTATLSPVEIAMNEKREIKPGDIFYIAGSITCLGVVVGMGISHMRVIILGTLEENKNNQFPMLKEIEYSDTIHPYGFEGEINLCKQGFSGDSRVLEDVDVVQHLLGGGVLEDYMWWGSTSKEYFLLLWAMLRGYFPGRVKKPPKKIECGNVLLWVYYTAYGKPYVVTMFRGEEDLAQQHGEGC